ncbi:Exoenzyme S synthesis regulatory protein ExsA [Vibrio mangrovi]|nr:Exoenzyme S synthesis regulatory protein ExsA [Vibrio mangrovi]
MDDTGIRDQEMQRINDELIRRLVERVPHSGKYPTAIAGLGITRWDEAETRDNCFYQPAIGIILQGRKESLIGGELFHYGAFDCLVNGVDVPSLSRVLEATPEQPMFAVSLIIDKELAMELVADMPPDNTTSPEVCPGVSLAPTEPEVLDVFHRLIQLLDKPEQIPLMAPLLIREVIVRILMSQQGKTLRKIYQQGSYSHQIATAIAWLKDNYMQPLSVERLASHVHMATSTFHRQFKLVTSLSPLQYQKRLRLYEAQKLMMVEYMDANTAGLKVGYESAQQFSREYKRLFGEPPYRNIQRLRQERA